MRKNEPKIIPLRVGYSNAVLVVNGANSILVDTGVRGFSMKIKMLFRQYQLKPADIKLIVLTHTHYDHTGNLRELKKYTGAPVLVHQNEFENLKNGFTPVPKGHGKYSRLISEFGRAVFPKYASPRPFVADLVNTGEFDLNEFGLDAKIISTPGHTNGSQSIVIGKSLIAGDAFINLKNGKIFPPFVNEPGILLQTWQRIFELGIEEIYPGHGPAFHPGKAFPDFEKWKKRL